MRRNELELHIPQNRTHLLNSIVGTKITNIYRFFRDKDDLDDAQQYFKEENRNDLEFFSYTSSDMLGIEFNQHTHIDFTRFKGRFLIKEAHADGCKFTALGWSNDTFKLDLKQTCPSGSLLKQALGKKVKEVNVVHFPAPPRYANNGLEFVLEDHSSLVLGVIPPDFAHNSIQFYLPKSAVLQQLTRTPVPEPRFKHLSVYKYKVAPKNELTNTPYLESTYSSDKNHIYNLNTDQHAALFAKKPQENYQFLRGVLSAIFEYQISILDMKFGFTSEGDLKIVSPVDVAKDFVLDYNILFIQALLDTIRKFYPEVKD